MNVFQKTPQEKLLLKQAKFQWKQAIKTKYPSDNRSASEIWKDRLTANSKSW